MAGEVIVDALPYIDQGYDVPGVREAALAMVEEECRRYKPTKNYLDHLGFTETTSFETELMKNELERIQNRVPMEGLAMKRYELPPPPPGKLSEVGAWTESVKNSMAQLEHQCVRAINLELMTEYGCEAWKSNLDVLTSLLAKAQMQLQELRKEIQEVNWQRKSKQMQAGDKLRSLEAHWVLLVSKNYEIEQACAQLEEDIYILKSKRKPKPEVTNGNGHKSPEEEEEEDSSSDEEEKQTEDRDEEMREVQQVEVGNQNQEEEAEEKEEEEREQEEPMDQEDSNQSEDAKIVNEESLPQKEESSSSPPPSVPVESSDGDSKSSESTE